MGGFALFGGRIATAGKRKLGHAIGGTNTEIPVSSVFIEDSSDGFTADQRIFWSGVRSRSIFARCLASFDKTPDAAYERYRGRGQRDENSWDQPTAADTTELCS